MKYACTYCGDFAQMELYNEIIVKLTPDYNIANIKEFFENHPKNEILIQILDTANFVEKDVINQIATLIPPMLYNYKLIINNPFDENSQIIMGYCKDLKISYFFDILIDDWDLLHEVLLLNPTDVYIVNEFAFELKEVSKVVHKAGAAVRVFPNVAQSRVSNTQDDLRKFFIRPEDLISYIPYVDTLEFLLPTNDSFLNQFYILVYATEGRWLGPLELIIAGLEYTHINNATLLPQFGLRRAICQKKCYKGSNCKFCMNVVHAADLIGEEFDALEYPENPKQKTMWDTMTEEEKQKLRQAMYNELDVPELGNIDIS